MSCIPILGISHNITIKKDRPIPWWCLMSSKVKLLATCMVYPLWWVIFSFENLLWIYFQINRLPEKRARQMETLYLFRLFEFLYFKPASRQPPGSLWVTYLLVAKLWTTNLRTTNLWTTYLRSTNLWQINLQTINFRATNLWQINLRVTNHRATNVWQINLWVINLQATNIYTLNPQETNLLPKCYFIFLFCHLPFEGFNQRVLENFGNRFGSGFENEEKLFFVDSCQNLP